ncbi:MAG: UPF0323 family lipoprotein [Campylobacteraceae bacterium]|nr:UPF0323 family lipoprotein [Campylobacteraceae bacterium]
MKKKTYINKLSSYALAGGLGVFLSSGLSGCTNIEQNQDQQGTNLAQKQNAFVVIEETVNGGYKIAEEFPAKKTTVVLRQKDGTQRILSKEEIDEIIKKENEKIQNGTSALTNPEISSGQMGLGGILLSSMAGAVLGSWIGNKLFGNQNYQARRATTYKTPQAYSRSASSFKKARNTRSSSKKSGFFGSSSKSSKSGGFGSLFGG